MVRVYRDETETTGGKLVMDNFDIISIGIICGVLAFFMGSILMAARLCTRLRARQPGVKKHE